ncbi:unnamed protein product [Rotaria sp. Silwood1]|nr:unnamed protein product [Rotaria sp. Silwood1]CAF4850840.1 unnamed protein product [Rotaria sp. Silwood1]
MIKTFNKLLGEQLLEHNESNNESNQISTNELNGKHVGLYFAAYSSSACRNFTPKLAVFLKGFNNRDRSKTLREKFNVECIPTLVTLFPTCEVIADDNIDADLVRGAYHRAVRYWCKGKCLFRSREAREGEHVWNGIICHQCNMSPIVGSRYNCTDQKCYVDFCETCLPKIKHEHPLVEYLVPTRQYSLEQLFKSVPYLLNSNSEEKIEIKTI